MWRGELKARKSCDSPDVEIFHVCKVLGYEARHCFWLNNTFKAEPRLLVPADKRRDQAHERLVSDHSPPSRLIRHGRQGRASRQYTSELHRNDYVTDIRFHGPAVDVWKNARHLAIVGPYQFIPSLVQLLRSFRRTSSLSLSFHPYGNVTLGRRGHDAAAAIERLVLDPLRLDHALRLIQRHT